MKSVLVTGGAGFIGSHLVDRLVREGFEVDVVDNLSSGHAEFVNETVRREKRFFEKDFSDSQVLQNIRNRKYDCVYHIAAVPRVSYSVEYPLESHDTNVSKTLQLVDACKGNTNRIVFASSSSVYGGADQLPTSESYPKSPKSPYALQKSIIEDYLQQYYMHYSLDSVSLRFFNVFGPRQLGGSPYSTAVSAWLTEIKKGGSMRSDGDGSQSRDMCYVDNVVDACYRAGTSRAELKADVFNVACGDRTTNKQILEFLLARYPGSKWHSAPWRLGDVMHTQADVSKLHEKLGYTPIVRFWEGLEKTIEWYDSEWDRIKYYGAKKC